MGAQEPYMEAGSPGANYMTEKSRKYYLVAEYDAAFDTSDGEVIAVTPWAAHDLTMDGRKYSLLQDNYSIRECVSGGDEYFEKQVRWADGIDKLIRREVPYCDRLNITPVMTHFSRFKYIVDTVVMRSYMIREFLKNARPGKVVYLAGEERGDEDRSFYFFRKRAMQILEDITVIACRQADIPVFTRERHPGAGTGGQGKPKGLKEMLKETLPVDLLKSVPNLINYGKHRKFFSGKRTFRGTNVLLLDAGTPAIDHVIKGLISRGCTVYIKKFDRVVLMSGLVEKKVFDCGMPDDEGFAYEIKRDCSKAFRKLWEDFSAFKWVDDQAGLGVSGIIKPYFEDFFKDTLPKFLMEVERMRDFYERKNINMVIARASVGQNYAGALVAANSMENIQTVCFQHSCTVLDLKGWSIDDLYLFDHYFATDDLSERYFRHCSGYPHIPECNVSQAPHYLRDIMGRKRSTVKAKRKRERVVYITKKLSKGMLRYNTFTYPITWYYDFQKKIVDYFGNKKNFDFVFKHAVGQEWAENTIHHYIREKGYGNIIIEDRPFVEYLDRADRIIMDYPSTGFFEASAA